MKIGAVTLAYNDESIITGTIKCLSQFVSKHIVCISDKPYFGPEYPQDRTQEIAEDLGCDVVVGDWKMDHDQRTFGNRWCKDCDWVLTFDSDEMMSEKDIALLIQYLHKTPYSAITNTPEVYWKSTDYRLRPKPTYQPVIATRPDVVFPYIRNVDCPFISFEDVTLHHLSWCYPKDILKKITTYAHAKDCDWVSWYNDVYDKWFDGKEVRFPYGEVHSAEYNPLPAELKKCLAY